MRKPDGADANVADSANPAETYDSYLVPALFAPWSVELLRRAAPRAGEAVLDLACGTGVVARAVAPMVGRQGEVTGLDVSPSMLEVARTRAAAERLPIAWKEGSALELPFPEQWFDLVVCQQGLQFFPDHLAALKEVRRVLRGAAVGRSRAVLAVWRDLAFHPVFEALDTAARRHLGASFAAPFSLGSADELAALCADAGFRSTVVEPLSLTVTYQDPDRWVDLSVRAGAAVMPQFAGLGPSGRAALVARIRDDMTRVLRAHTRGDRLAMATHAHVVTASG
jgi:ubiquinone/menaquinone biosynthesis C-methylase UbiE